MKAVFSFEFAGVNYTVLVDGRFTLLWAYRVESIMWVHDELKSQIYSGFGQAFCSHEDTFDLGIGIEVALGRLFRNVGTSGTHQYLIRDAVCKAYNVWKRDNGCL